MWKTVKLGDVCRIVNGSTPSRKESRFWEDGDVSWFTIDDMREQGRDIFSTAQHVTQSAVEEKKAKVVPENSVLLCCTASIGEAAIARQAMATNQQFNALTPVTEELLCEYLYYVATTLKAKLLSVSGSTTISFVSMGKLKEIEIPLPPLAEQQRIVAKLDSAFAEIDRAIDAVAEKARQAALLRQSAIDNLIEKRGVAITTLRDAIEIKHGFAFRSEFFETEGNMVLLTPGNFEEAGGYRDRGEKQKYYVGECPSEFVLEGGDLLVAMTEQAKGLLGSPIIVPDDGIFLHNQRLGKVQPKKQLSLAWLFHYFNTSTVREQLHQTGTGLKVRHTSPTKIGDLKIKIPPLDEQINVAHTLDSIITEQKNLASHYEKQTEQLIALKSAILAQELQPQQSEAA